MLPRYIIVMIIAIQALLILRRMLQLKQDGIIAMQFAGKDKRDFWVLPLAAIFLYLVLAAALQLPTIGSEIYNNLFIAWVGVIIATLGLLLFQYTMKSFADSIRVGIDEENPGQLITAGAFAVSRNPLYMAFIMILLGAFLVVPNWAMLLCIIGVMVYIANQIRLEEMHLRKVYGAEYIAYCTKVRRFL